MILNSNANLSLCSTERYAPLILESDQVVFYVLPQSFLNTEMSLPDHNVEILKTLRYLSSVIESIKKPLGTRENPARVCKDLLDCHHKLSDGESLKHVFIVARLQYASNIRFSVAQLYDVCKYTILFKNLIFSLIFRLVLGGSKLGLHI